MAFHRTIPSSELRDGEMRGVNVAGIRVLLLNWKGKLLAYQDACPHQETPLSEGKIEGEQIVCRAHGWRFDAATGCGIALGSRGLRSFPLRIEGGAIWVDVSG